MQVVTGVVLHAHSIGSRRVTNRGVEIGDRVEHAGGSNPCVDREAIDFAALIARRSISLSAPGW
jgi:hypothetical protein